VNDDGLSAAEEVMLDIAEELETDRYQVIQLETNRAWLSLRGHLLKKREKERRKLVDGMLKRRASPVDQREVDYARGMIDTIDFILGLPDRMREERDRAD
jgi:hypothetical protein